MTTIVTAVYGRFDQIRPQVYQDIPVDWVCYTDDPDLEAPAPWLVVVKPALYADPRLAAKVHKCRAGKDRIWVDANMQVTSRTFAREALAARHDGIAIWRHPRRNCIYDEAEASLGTESQGGKYDGMPLREQVAAYRAEGHPEHGGLYAGGTVAWSEDRADLASAWMAECVMWSVQDQLSFPVVCRRLGVTPGVFPVDQTPPRIRKPRRPWIENRWLRIHYHQTPTAA